MQELNDSICHAEAHLNAALALIFILGYIFVKLIMNHYQPLNADLQIERERKADEAEKYLRRFQADNHQFFNGVDLSN